MYLSSISLPLYTIWTLYTIYGHFGMINPEQAALFHCYPLQESKFHYSHANKSHTSNFTLIKLGVHFHTSRLSCPGSANKILLSAIYITPGSEYISTGDPYWNRMRGLKIHKSIFMNTLFQRDNIQLSNFALCPCLTIISSHLGLYVKLLFFHILFSL